MKTFLLQTFGCKANQYESQGIREAMLAAGWVEVCDPAEAEAAIFNTCAVTVRANTSCRNATNAVRRANPRIRVVITGCAIAIGEKWPPKLGAELLVPNPRKHLIPALLDKAPCSAAPEDRFAFSLSGFAGHTRAFVKIQDGCDNCCSYCIIPRARGKPVSRPFADIVAECRRLADNGYLELVLTGITIGRYRHEGKGLPELLETLAGIGALRRLRLSSIEPLHISEGMLRAFAESEKVCPHLHLPLQSGDDRILQLMNRGYTAAEYLRIARRAREILPGMALTTDVIVGFPGEGDEEFANTLRTVEAANFARTHVFLFSRRPGTPAAEMKQTAPDREIKQRKDTLLKLAETSAAKYARSFVGKEVSVLAEEREGTLLAGYTREYLRATFAGPADLLKREVRLRITAANGATLTGCREDSLPDEQNGGKPCGVKNCCS